MVTLVFGIALCFFGGSFTAAIAAIEAFRHCGGSQSFASLRLLRDEWCAVSDASAADSVVDADGDGVADVLQIPKSALFARKMKLAATTIRRPERLTAAIGTLWSAYVSVLATLRLPVAQTAALALGMLDASRVTLTRMLAHPIASLLGDKLAHWVETLLLTLAFAVTMLLAWILGPLAGACYSALRGGKLAADAAIGIVVERGWATHVEKLGDGWSLSGSDLQASNLDELLCYGLAGVGLAFQLAAGFTLHFPWDLLLAPLLAVEYFLRWQASALHILIL